MRRLLPLLLLFSLTTTALAQTRPIIESFTVDGPVSYFGTERGVAFANFSWRAVDLRPDDRMQMHALVGAQWVLIGEGFEPAKTDTLVISHPLTFDAPTYRLSVVDSVGERVAEAFLRLDYLAVADAPTIDFFNAITGGTVQPASILTEPLLVQWRVNNRPWRANLIFEQVMPDGSVVRLGPAENDDWIHGHSTGQLTLRDPGPNEDVVLRLRVMDIDTLETLATRELVLFVEPSVSPTVRAISATPDPATPGETVTVSWQIEDTDAVWIEVHNGAGLNCNFEPEYLTLLEAQPATGSAQIVVPELNYSPLEFRVYTDFYVPRNYYDYRCSTFAEPTVTLTTDLTDYVGKGVTSFEVVEPATFAGGTATVTWDVSRGESVTLRLPEPDWIGWQAIWDQVPVVATYTDLPLSGSLEVPIPDNIQTRAGIFQYVLLYIEDGIAPAPDAHASIPLDMDLDLTCAGGIRFTTLADGADVAPGASVSVTWESCGLPNTRLKLRSAAFGAPLPRVTTPDDGHLSVESAGSQVIDMPPEPGRYAVDLAYVHEGTVYLLERLFLDVVYSEQ